MRQLTALVLAIALVGTTTGCANEKVIVRGATYGSYGVVNREERENPEIQYDISWGNAFWGVVASPTIILPIYFFGYNLYQPVGIKAGRGGVLPPR